MPTSISLTPQHESFLREQVSTGRYNNISEVVSDALRLLERRQQEDAAKLTALRRAVAAGVASIDEDDATTVESQDIEAMVSKLRARDTPSIATRTS